MLPRRFWVIPIATESIDTDKLTQERDAIWAGAVQAYQANEQYFLTREEEDLSLANNDRFEVSDEWQAEIEEYLTGRDRVSISEVLLNQFDIEPANQDRATQMRVANILVRLNWQKAGKTTHLGKRQRIWESKKVKKQNIENGGAGGTSRTHENKNVPPVHSAPPSSKVLKNDFFSSKLWGDKPRYVPPDNAFEPNERVIYEKVCYRVVHSTHTHVLLEGFEKSIPIWQVERIDK